MPEFAAELAAADPTAVALADHHRDLTWTEVNDSLNRCANLLLAMDLGPKRRISVFAENAGETALAHLGGLLAGCSTVPVNFHLTAEEAAYIVSDSESRVIFADESTFSRAQHAASEAGIEFVIVWGANIPEGAIGWAEWLSGGSPDHPPMDTKPLPNLLYTSGTTGLPKGTELPPTMFAGGGDMAEHLEALKKNRLAAFGTHLVVGPMYHTGPLSGMRLLVAGVSSVIRGRFDAEATLAAIDQYKTTTSVMVPTHFVRMLALPEDVRAKYDVSSMKLIAHTGAKCPIDVKRQMIEWFGPVFRDSYGASEVGTTCSITSEEWLEYPGSVGKAVPPFVALVLDDDNNELPANTEGRLFFRDETGRGVIYPNDPEKTAAAHVAPGVFTLGEIAYMNEDGYVYLTDRFSDMVVSGGTNIYPAEAELVLIDHPDVADIGCIGVPDPDMGESLKALIIPTNPDNPPAEAAIIAWCKERLTSYKCPRSVDIVDTIGRNTMGKVNKRKLRAPYWE